MAKQILIVDNDQLIVEFMRDILVNEGYEVITANDGLSALDLLEKQTPDIIFTDLVMPKIDGKQLCRIIRQIPRFDQVFLVVLSGLVTENKVSRDEVPADAMIAKGSFDQITTNVLDILHRPEAHPQAVITGDAGAAPADITDELVSAKRHLEVILERMSEGVLELTAGGRIIYANPAVSDLFGLSEEQLLGADAATLFAETDRKRVQAILGGEAAEKTLVNYEQPLSVNGHQLLLRTISAGDNGSIVAIVNDISDLKQAEAALRQRNVELTMLHNASQAFNSTLDLDEVLSNVLEEVRRIMNITGSTIWLKDQSSGGLVCRHATGRRAQTLCGWRLDPGEGVAGWVAQEGKSVIVKDTRSDNRHFKKADKTSGTEIRSTLVVPLIVRDDCIGAIQVVDEHVGRFSEWHLKVLQPLTASAAIAIENARLYEQARKEIEERAKIEQRIAYNAFHDRLTGLANQALFEDRLMQAIQRAKRRSEYAFAVILMGLDRFKAVKDTLGHDTGEQILIRLAKDLKAFVRAADTVARLGGDEFSVLVHDVDSSRDAIQIANRIQREVVMHLDTGDQNLSLTASAGLIIWHPRYAQPKDILRDAETAMYRAKKSGKGRCLMFDEAMHAEAIARLKMEHDLMSVMQNRELRVYYQPVVSLDSGRICGMEALLRWQHPKRGLVSPLVFIPIAEQIGLIHDMGAWVLKTACRQLKTWQQKVPHCNNLHVAVNISGRQFSQRRLVDTIATALQESAIEPSSLKLEITESVIMDNADNAVNLLNELKDLKVQLAIDDFGTGYSSLSYLNSFPVDELKVDRSFVCRMNAENRQFEIVKTVVALAKTLGMRVVAEGIESRAQLKRLRELECQYGQGFLFAKPQPPEEMAAMLAQQPCW